MNTQPCKGCQKPIIYARSTKSGSLIPIDFDLHGAPETNVKGALFHVSADGAHAMPIMNAQDVFGMIRNRDDGPTIFAEFEGGDEAQEVEISRIGISHYKTCPNASQFGKART